MSEGQQRKNCNKKRQHGNEFTSPFLNWDKGGIILAVRCCHGNWDEIRAGPHKGSSAKIASKNGSMAMNSPVHF